MARFFQPKKKTTLNQKHQAVSVTKLDHQGAGIAFQDNKPVFIDGALPGEEVLMQLTESKSKFARAKLIKVLKPSGERVEPFCPHYGECGGCDLQHLAHSAQIEHKQQALSQLMAKFAGQTLALSAPVCCDDQGYRRRARLSLLWDKKSSQLQFGFRRKQSKNIVTVTDCAVLEPSLNALLPELKTLLSDFARPDQLGHVELVKGDNTRVLVLRHLAPLAKADMAALSGFAEQHALTLYLMPASDELNLICGPEAEYLEAGVTIPFLPSHFIQVNQQVNQAMVKQALSWLDVQPQDRVLDLFCGLGNFSLPLAKLAKEVVGVEGVDDMVRHAQSNAARNQISNTDFYQANLEQDMTNEAWAGEKFAKVLLDPARAGAAGIVEQLARLGAQRVVYVSCNPATLARDSQSLLSQGYQLVKLGMLDMFPHTSHLESMALFVKNR
ncbi:23S rRNA (uracil(1939)-C(5))-methyltransferase RlmD [Vibrio sp. ABG19]|uniref:23S rRNA (uracil(1939)-C(5))-methyltransferase RlmD n=1 Tax=Vibrio sp. ABG19 TaxID=2817385 RepID=UPI00249E918B|nr:23S rRNA (uracil(1939)-C(5))-methyltransferase RlmD [Vibrio sp. ABG19]WGY47893.1 23S rRNA (uracil(1939)-C(5))-methyltransferase RlmD [Vibrio sp. ABG19]